MAKRTATDPRQLSLDSLFEIPEKPPVNIEGSMNHGEPLREAISAAIRASNKDRFQVAAELSRLTGCPVTKYIIDAWTADSKEGHRFPAEYLPALCQVLDTSVMELLARMCGGKIFFGPEVLEAALGQLNTHISEAYAKRKQLERQIQLHRARP